MPDCKCQDCAIPLHVLQKANGWIFFVNVLFPDFVIPMKTPFFVVVVVAELLIFQTGDAECVLCDVIFYKAVHSHHIVFKAEEANLEKLNVAGCSSSLGSFLAGSSS